MGAGRGWGGNYELILSYYYQSLPYPTSQHKVGGKENHFLLYLNKDAFESDRVLSTLYSLTHLTLTTAL